VKDKNAVKRGLGAVLIGTGILIVSIGIWGANPPEPLFTGLPLVCTLLWAFGAITFVRGLNGWDFWAWLFSEKDEQYEAR
jgi:hypothetical protein